MSIDQSALNILRTIQPDGERHFLRRIITLYMSSTQDSIDKLTSALNVDDIVQLIRPAHSMKSSSANIGAMQLMKSCEKLEFDSRQGRFNQNRQQIENVIKEYQRVVSFFKIIRLNSGVPSC